MILSFTFSANAHSIAAPATPADHLTTSCNVLARSIESIAALLETEIATPAATTGGTTLPAGTPVDPVVAARMEQTVRCWLACQNAGEPLRAWSLFSDGYLYRLLKRQDGVLDETLATPTPTQGETATLIAIRGQRLLPDGRAGATVTIGYPSVPMPKTFFFFFTEAEKSDRLLIDGILGEISFSVP